MLRGNRNNGYGTYTLLEYMKTRTVQLFGYLFASLYFGIKIIPNPNLETDN
jgi:hypothetical protein